jgi:hypothetical protein
VLQGQHLQAHERPQARRKTILEEIPMRSTRSCRHLGFPLLVVSIFLALAVPVRGHADEITLTLRSGNALRGEVIATFPGDRLILRLPSGRLQSVLWKELRDPPPDLAPPSAVVQDATEPPAPAAPPVPATPPPLVVLPAPALSPATLPPAAGPPGEATPPGQIALQMTSNRPGTTLLRIERSLSASGFVGGYYLPEGSLQIDVLAPKCIAPCNTWVDATAVYRIGGPGITPSRSFVLPSSSGPVALRVRAGLLSRFYGGVLLGGLGLATTAAGAIILGTRSLHEGPLGQNPSPFGSTSGLTGGGAALVTIGAIALVTGISLWATSRTRITFESGPSAGSRVSLGPQGLVF